MIDGKIRKQLRELYNDMWNCLKLDECKKDFPTGYYNEGYYCQIPFVGKFWGMGNRPKLLFVMHNPRLGPEDEETIREKYQESMSNTMRYAEKTLIWKPNGEFSKDFDKLHYSFQIAGTESEDFLFFGLLQNEIWTGYTYQYGLMQLLIEVFDKWYFGNPNYIVFYNLVPCSGKSEKNRPTAVMYNNCKDRKVFYLGRIINLLSPDIIWVLGKQTNDKFIEFLLENDFLITNDIEGVKWAYVIENKVDKKKIIVLRIRHPSPQSRKEGLGEISLEKVIEHYYNLFRNWEDNLENITNWLIRKINKFAVSF